MDKNGVALGNLVIGQGEARHDYCIDLLKAGMAHCDERAVDRMGAAGQVINRLQAIELASILVLPSSLQPHR
jgi:aspartate oxidase